MNDFYRPVPGWKKDSDNFKKMSEELSKHKYKCKCGHSVIIPYNVDNVICTWCRRTVLKDDKRYFKDKMRQMLNKKEGGNR